MRDESCWFRSVPRQRSLAKLGYGVGLTERWSQAGMRVQIVNFPGTRVSRHREGGLILRSVWLAKPLPGEELQAAHLREAVGARPQVRRCG